jgi:parvulin-like peptidyl-prolyl isomerase
MTIGRPSRTRTRFTVIPLLGLLGALAAARLMGAATPAASAAPAASATAAPGDSALARYDGGVIYPHDFREGWWMLSPPQRPPGDPLDSRKAFLRSVVDRKLVAEAAHKHPFTLAPEESVSFQRDYDQLLENALFTELTKDVPPPSDAEVERYRRRRTFLAEVRFVNFASAERAHSWRSRLMIGTPFSKLDQAIRREGPALATADSFRFVAAEQIPDTLAQIIWSMRPGQVSDVLPDAAGPTIILLRTFLRRPGAMGGENAGLRMELQTKQYARIRENFRAQLAQKVGRTFEMPNMQKLLEAHLRIPPRTDVDSVTGKPVIRPNLPMPVMAWSDTGLVLARAGSTTVTVMDYLRFYARMQSYARPEIREMESLEGAVDRIALAPALLAAAKERGLDNRPSLVATLANMREGFAVSHFYHDMFETKVVVTEDGLRKLWSADPAHYNDRASVTPRILAVDRESLADSLAKRLAAGASFVDLVKEYSIDGVTAEKGGLTGEVYEGTQENAELEHRMINTPVGKWGGPERTPQGFTLWRIESARPGVKRSFEDARWMVERDYKILEADRLLTAWLDGLKKSLHVEYYDDRITPTLGRGGPWD